jgi:DET1- and DDB1-associated protein 1
MAGFLEGLPSYDKSNFENFRPEDTRFTSDKKCAVYLCTRELPSRQVITTEKTNILMRFLHKQWDRKSVQTNTCKKRAASMDLNTESKLPRQEEGADDASSGNTADAVGD